jgi:hypothetical protein
VAGAPAQRALASSVAADRCSGSSPGWCWNDPRGLYYQCLCEVR